MSSRLTLVVGLCLGTFAGGVGRAGDWSEARFDKQVATILAARCLDCHSGSQAKGKLNLADKKDAFRGGESGAGVVAGKPLQSLIWKRIAAGEMPPEKPLPRTKEH